MAFALIRPESGPFLDAARSADARPVDADRAAAALRSDFERWSRWSLGMLGFVLAAGGAFVAVGLSETVRMLGGVPQAVDLTVIVISAVIGVGGVALLTALWWSGRRLLSAISWWLRLPYAQGGRQRRAGGWLQARTVNFEPRVFVRIVSGTLALLLAVGGIALFIRDLNEQVTSMTAVSAAVGVIALAVGVGQIGGVMRLVSGVAEADPLWARIRAAFARR
ncbi:hypothetical protein [Microbacterium saperdae]|uniref:Uncharacterized protein n=1 Tax=Microbacterium saperdae TaxID=69368 RepID=A0A543BC08_9MICO|nr:hypothetical protein [Microbacterium saperdae]TQL82385.1 hypothetical protein FB560_3869 [Microbacterium saperdae]GGM39417.1 hypothetical protein GCM10010489_08050 [Microbacterium saperdae]